LKLKKTYNWIMPVHIFWKPERIWWEEQLLPVQGNKIRIKRRFEINVVSDSINFSEAYKIFQDFMENAAMIVDKK